MMKKISDNLRFFTMMQKLQRKRDIEVMSREHINNQFLNKVV